MTDVPHSVWLVGLSGAGKSTVGPLLARLLGYGFVDLDERVEALAGATIPEVFRREGEARFRALEGAATAELAARAHVVVATGGGWMARSDIERSAPRRVRLWLRVSPETAIHRLAGAAVDMRPMLAGADPQAVLAELLASRERAYGEAELVVETDGMRPENIAAAAHEGLLALGVESATTQEIENHS